MMALIFLLFFAIGVVVLNNQQPRTVMLGMLIVLFLTAFWVNHHISDPLSLQW